MNATDKAADDTGLRFRNRFAGEEFLDCRLNEDG
jgi:hypothetical protein